MAKYQAYPVYQSANSQWIDIIPLEWIRAPLKFLVSDRITDGPHETPNFIDDGIPFLSAEAIKFNKLDFSRKRSYISLQLHEKYSLKCSPQRDDIFMVKSGNTTGAVAIVDTDEVFNIWSPLALIRSNKKIVIPRYVYYSILAEFFQISVQLSWSQGTQPNIGMGVIENLHLTYPTLIVQKKIVSFLDHETTKIDNLIEKQQQLIELLKEKRQAVISHAVTKGLNPDAPMKDSGVEWLGEVPEHWIVRRLKHTSNLQSGIPKGKDLTGKKHISVPMLRVANVQDGYLNLEEVHLMKIEPEQLERYALRNGDVLMNEGGDNDKLGRGAVWKGQINDCIHQNHVFAIRPFFIEPEWLDMITRASYAKYHFYCVAKQSTNLASISSTNIKETPLTIPPKLERAKILDHLNKKLEKLDRIEENCFSLVKLLQERRTALISAAVTGKIDVRNWVAPEAKKAEVSQEATA